MVKSKMKLFVAMLVFVAVAMMAVPVEELNGRWIFDKSCVLEEANQKAPMRSAETLATILGGEFKINNGKLIVADGYAYEIKVDEYGPYIGNDKIKIRFAFETKTVIYAIYKGFYFRYVRMK